MKKHILTFLVILASVFALLTILDLGSDYGPERSLWFVERDYAEISTHLDSAPDYAVSRMADKFKAFIQKYPDTRLAAQAQLLLAKMYMLKKDYPKARAEYYKLNNIYSKDAELLAQAQVNAAKTYEIEGNWVKALIIYDQVIENYPLTPTGFYIPVYIAQYYRAQDKNALAQAAYERAIKFYEIQADKYPGSLAEYNAFRLIFLCRFEEKKWEETLDAATAFMMKFPIGGVLQQTTNIINYVCVSQLHDYDRAIGIYGQFMAKYPQHPLIPVFKNMVKALQTIKNKVVVH